MTLTPFNPLLSDLASLAMTVSSYKMVRSLVTANGKIVASNRRFAVMVRDCNINKMYLQFEQWFQENEVDAVYVTGYNEIYFARDEDRTMFILRWAE